MSWTRRRLKRLRVDLKIGADGPLGHCYSAIIEGWRNGQGTSTGGELEVEEVVEELERLERGICEGILGGEYWNTVQSECDSL